jgi:hypothetical protein
MQCFYTLSNKSRDSHVVTFSYKMYASSIYPYDLLGGFCFDNFFIFVFSFRGCKTYPSSSEDCSENYWIPSGLYHLCSGHGC